MGNGRLVRPVPTVSVRSMRTFLLAISLLVLAAACRGSRDSDRSELSPPRISSSRVIDETLFASSTQQDVLVEPVDGVLVVRWSHGSKECTSTWTLQTLWQTIRDAVALNSCRESADLSIDPNRRVDGTVVAVFSRSDGATAKWEVCYVVENSALERSVAVIDEILEVCGTGEVFP